MTTPDAVIGSIVTHLQELQVLMPNAGAPSILQRN